MNTLENPNAPRYTNLKVATELMNEFANKENLPLWTQTEQGNVTQIIIKSPEDTDHFLGAECSEEDTENITEDTEYCFFTWGISEKDSESFLTFINSKGYAVDCF